MKLSGVWGVEQLFPEMLESGRANMFCCCVGNNVVIALVLWYDLVGFVRPSDMMIFEGDVARFCRDQRSFGEID